MCISCSDKVSTLVFCCLICVCDYKIHSLSEYNKFTICLSLIALWRAVLEGSEVCLCTLVIVLCQVLLVYVEVVVSVQLPELAVDNIEMFIGEELCQLVHVLFLLQQRHILQQKKMYVFFHY